LESPNVLSEDERQAVDKFMAAGGHVIAPEKPNWLVEVQSAIGSPSAKLIGPRTVRVVVQDQSERAIVHMYNLNVQRLSSFEDKVEPAENISLEVKVPFADVRSVELDSADETSTRGALEFTNERTDSGSSVKFSILPLEVSALVIISK
jgi:hypothetical protein